MQAAISRSSADPGDITGQIDRIAVPSLMLSDELSITLPPPKRAGALILAIIVALKY
jgi:hypothetical protein